MNFARCLRIVFIALPAFAITSFHSAPAAQPNPKPTIRLTIDARDIPFRVVYSTLHVPVKPGPVALVYPKWIPGMHRVAGPINNLAGIKMSAGGKTIRWQRDADDGFTFHCNVPDGCTSLKIQLAYAVPRSTFNTADSHAGVAATSNMAVINWNALLLYPKGIASVDVVVEPTLRLPDGWKFGTALRAKKKDKTGIQFEPAPLTEVVDSPVMAGEALRSFDLGEDPVPHRLVVTADSPKMLEHVGKVVEPLKRLIAESKLLFGRPPFRRYQFLLHLSTRMPSSGLEHHESTILGDFPGMFSKTSYPTHLFMVMAHEYVHAWNGKYRRPKGMVCRDFQQPQRTGMLWVYEGLTQYLGMVLAVRCGAWSPERFRDTMSTRMGTLAYLRRYDWRPLADAAIGAPSVAYPPGSSWRTRSDYYDEGALLWLQIDALIRKETNGKKSLDGFCKRFFPSDATRPTVKPYDFDELVDALNATIELDWKAFLNRRLYAESPTAMIDGVRASGWNLVLSPKGRGYGDFRYSVGVRISSRTIGEVMPNSIAAKAGLKPNWRLIAVNKKKGDMVSAMRSALAKAKKDGKPIEIEMQPPGLPAKSKTVLLKYTGGDRQPALVRIVEQPDLLAAILRSRIEW